MVNESVTSAGTFVAPTEDNAPLLGTTATLLASGTNTIGTFAQIAAFSEIETQTPASTDTKNRVGWL